MLDENDRIVSYYKSNVRILDQRCHVLGVGVVVAIMTYV